MEWAEEALVPTIEIEVSDRIARHLASVRLMSYMVFPDNPELRVASEVTFRTQLADWYAEAFAKQNKEVQRRGLRKLKSSEERARAFANPSAWMRNKLFSDFLEPLGGVIGGAVALTTSPSADELKQEWTRRWFGVVYTGKLVCLIFSINEHHPQVGASLNKAIYVLRETDGKDKERNAGFRQFGFPAVYESSLKEAWRRFKPVAHLCAAYVTTESYYYEDELSRDFMEYWLKPPAFYQDDAFGTFVRVARSVEQFATTFRPHGQRHTLITKDEIYSLPERIFDSEAPPLSARTLTDDEIAVLKTYRAPKQFV
jgi:hypothetical protein